MIEEKEIQVDGAPVRYLTASEGPPLLLLHALGESALDWRWVFPALARGYTVYAPDLPGFGGSAGGGARPAFDYSPASFARFAAGFLDAVGAGRAAVVGNSLGGLAALRLVLSEPERVGSLCLVSSAGLGRAVSLALRAPSLPFCGELGAGWSGTPVGAAQRALAKAGLLFARPHKAPAEWFGEQYRMARIPRFMEATLAALRAQVDAGGQREVLLDRIAELDLPTLVVWGTLDRVFPPSQAHDAVARLRRGCLDLIPNSGHLPQVERPDRFAATVGRFLEEHPPR